MTEATIYNVSRLCKASGNCDKCVLGENNNGRNVPCESLIIEYPGVKIIRRKRARVNF